VGTTVTVSSLFRDLPVRHREFLKNARAQYAKALHVLQAYAIISTGVKMTCTHTSTGKLSSSSSSSSAASVTKKSGKSSNFDTSWSWDPKQASSSSSKGQKKKSRPSASGEFEKDSDNDDSTILSLPPTPAGRHVVFGSSGSNSLADAIVDVFGAAFLSTLEPVSIDLSQQTLSTQAGKTSTLSESSSSSSTPFFSSRRVSAAPASSESIVGFVSKTGTGIARSNNEKQFIYLNGRPVDIPKLTKLMNEVWRQYEMGHKPAFILNLQLRSGSFDVNVSPDKRDIFLVAETGIFDALRSGLNELWGPSRHTFTVRPLVDPIAAFSLPVSSSMAPQQQGKTTRPATSSSTTGHIIQKQDQDGLLHHVTENEDEELSGKEDRQSCNTTTLGSKTKGKRATVEATNNNNNDKEEEEDDDDDEKEKEEEEEEEEEEELNPSFSSSRLVKSNSSPTLVEMTAFYSSLSDSKRDKTTTAVVKTTSDEKSGYEKDEAMQPDDLTESTALMFDNSDLAIDQSLLGNNQEDEEGTWTQERKRSALRGIPHSSSSSSASSSSFSTSPPPHALSPSLGDSSLSPIVNSSTVILSRSSKRASLKRSRSPTPPDAPTQIVPEYDDERAEQMKASESDDADVDRSDDPDVSSKSDVVETNVTNLSTTDDEDGVNLTPSLLKSKEMSPSLITKGVQSSSQKGSMQTEQTNVRRIRSLYKSIHQKENAFASSSLNGSSRTSRGLFDRRRNFDDNDDEDDDKHLTSLFAPLSSAATSISSSISSNSSSSFDELTPISSQSSSLAGLSSSIEEASLACTRVLSKAHFKEMATKIYGQFNLGFIIAGVGHDLFILDQHACDEKFRFESLRRDTEIHVQRLLVPRDIDLTAAEELVILGNLDVFARNGFHFTISGGGERGEEEDLNMQSTEKRKIRVSAFPFSKQTQFGDEDVRELASILADRGGGGGDGGGQREEAYAIDNGDKSSHDDSCGHIHSEIIEEDVPADSSRAIKLPRLNAMFASRACRSAVMIGTALEHYMMRKIVHQMAALEDPWCCPHGRPTLRHLVDLSSLKAVAKKLSIPGRETKLL